jgi:CRP-like cAMP-binding protein
LLLGHGRYLPVLFLHPLDFFICVEDQCDGATVNLKQYFLAEMLGVQRTSVSDVAGRIQTLGAITYSRGTIKIIDRSALEEMSCECYETLSGH